MTTNDDPLSTYRPGYVAGLERRVEELEGKIAQALAVIENVEYVWDLNEEVLLCPWCEAWQYHEPHKDDCPREAALEDLRRVAGLQNTKGAK